MNPAVSLPHCNQGRSCRRSGRRAAGAGLLALALILAYAAAGSAPTAGQVSSEVTVAATLRIASSCLIVSPTAVDFGTVEFTRPPATRPSPTPAATTATVSLRNCSSQSETILVRGAPATGAGVLWGHAPPGADVCLGPNLFIQGVRDAAGAEKRLSITDQAFKSLPAGATEPIALTLTPPCSGSTGAGQTVTVKYTFVATLSEHGSR